MNLGNPVRELEVEPLEWPQAVPEPAEPRKESAPAQVPAEAVPAKGGGE